MYAAESVDLSSTELSHMNYDFDSIMQRIFEVDLNLLDIVCTCTNSRDLTSDIEVIKCKFVDKRKAINNVINGASITV